MRKVRTGKVPRVNGVTLAICTFNGAARIQATLDHVASQIAKGVNFEVLVVDNASTDATVEIVHSAWPTSLADKLRVVREPRPGVANARLRAIREARYTILSFIDDDNWISSNWVSAISDIFEAHPNVAIVHAHSAANLTVPEPDDFPIFSGWLAIGSLVEYEGVVKRRPISFWTAGISLRLAALEFLEDPNFTFALTGRIGGRTLGGEDHELCLCILLAGWDAYATRTIGFVHDIPCSRLNRSYIEQLVENGGRSRRILNEYRAQFSPSQYPTGLRLFISNLWEFLKRSLAYHIKRLTGRLGSGVSPSALSYRLARGKLLGYFSTSKQVHLARRNIELVSRYRHSDFSRSESAQWQ